MNPESNKKIEEILGSLDGIRKAPAPDFFYTRLIARMEKGSIEKTARPLLLRPVYIIAGLFVILLVNALVLFNSGRSKTFDLTETEMEQTIAAEYSLNTNLTYEINQ